MTVTLVTSGATILRGLNFKETAGSAAVLTLHDSLTNDNAIWSRTLRPGESDDSDFSSPRMCSQGLTVDVTGTVTYNIRQSASASTPNILRDVAYGDPANLETMDVIIPSGTGPFPMVFTLHGGGGAVGDKSVLYSADWDGNSPYTFANAGYVVFNLNYPLANGLTQTNQYPTPNNSVLSAISYARTHAASYLANVNKVAIYGGSAGGRLALWAGETLSPGNVWVKSVIAASPNTDLRYSDPRGSETLIDYYHSLNTFGVVVFHQIGACSGGGLDYPNGTCDDSMNPASPIVATTDTPAGPLDATAAAKFHVFVSTQELVPLGTAPRGTTWTLVPNISDYVKAVHDASMTYTFDISGALVASQTTNLASLGVTYTNYNTTGISGGETINGEHAGYPGGMAKYLSYLATDLA